MKINFLTTDLTDASGGAIYDSNFFSILASVHSDVHLYNDKWFLQKGGIKNNLISFNKYYKKAIQMLMDCDYLVFNSRLYTRMVFFNWHHLKKQYPRTKVIVIHHHSNYLTHTGMSKKIHKYLESKVLKCAGELVIPNEYVIDQVKRDIGVTSIKWLPSSFEKREFKKSELNSHILLFVGNIEERKGIRYGLEAFSKIHEVLPQYKYHLIGKYKDDDYFKSLKEYIDNAKLTDCIVFEGRVSEERLDKMYSTAELFLFPSLLEGYGWVMMEAMGRGLPVVAFNNSAMPYTVKDGQNGLLIENLNVKEMASRTIELLNNREEMLKLQKGAFKSYEDAPDQNDLNSMTREYFELWTT